MKYTDGEMDRMRFEEPEGSYDASIIAPVRYDKRLPMGARMLYAEIRSLCKQNGNCWASNKYFADRFEMEPRTVTRWLKQLAECGHIVIRIDKKQGNKRTLFLAEAVKAPIHKIVQSYGQNCRGLLNKEIEVRTTPPTPSPVFGDPVLEKLWTDWCGHRKEMRKPITSSAREMQIKKLRLMGVPRAIAALRHSIESGYTGIYEPREFSGKAKGGNDKPWQHFDKQGRRVDEYGRYMDANQVREDDEFHEEQQRRQQR